MANLTIFTDRCKGCYLCVNVCPKKILTPEQETLNSKGYYPVTITDKEACIACAMCAMMCPDCVIQVEK